ncbi:MAG: four helix bundle protein [Planctomycetota bacterium]|nr:four helix bundle protein [Planctomycetota bacterium]
MKQPGDQGFDLRLRTRQFALRIIRMYTTLPKRGREEVRVLGTQVLRSGTSVGAHYREAYRAKSDKDYVNKLQGALQELEETRYWMELLVDSEIVSVRKMSELFKESDELTAIIVTIVRKAKSRSPRTTR